MYMKISDYNVDSIKDFDEDYLLFTVSIDSTGYNYYYGLCDYKGEVVLKPKYSSIIKVKDTNFIMAVENYEFKPNVNKILFIFKNEDLKNRNFDENIYDFEFNSFDVIRDKNDDKRVYIILSVIDENTNEKIYIVLDKDGNIIFTSNFEINYCNDGVFRTIYSPCPYIDGEYWYQYYNSDIDKDIPLLTDNHMFFGGYAKTYSLNDVDKKAFIDKNGEYTDEFISCTDFHKSNTGRYTAIVKRKYSSTYDVIDRDLKTIFSVDSSNYELTQTDFDVYVITDKKTHSKGIIDIAGNIIIPCMYGDITITSNGIIKCYNDYYDILGNEINIPNWYRLSLQNEKVLVLSSYYEDNGTYAFIDSKGNNLFNTWFDSYDDVKNNRAIVSKKEISYEANDPFEFTRFSVVDLDGNVIFSYPNDDIYDSLEYLDTLDHSCYIGKIKGSDEYILFSDSGFELKRFHSEVNPSLFDGFFSYKENGKYNLWFIYGSSTPIFDAIYDYVDKDITYNNSDFIDIINRRCFISNKDDEKNLYVNCGGYFDIINISKKKVQKDPQKFKSLFFYIFK